MILIRFTQAIAKFEKKITEMRQFWAFSLLILGKQEFLDSDRSFAYQYSTLTKAKDHENYSAVFWEKINEKLILDR